jgi:uncharacterized protein (DUF488 family)
LLREAGIELVVDVRRFPGSRRHPHFGREALEKALTAAGVRYRHEVDLGGRREPRQDSRNGAWRVAAFRGYADHMSSPEFHAAFERVLQEAVRYPTAVMCAEAHPSRCHRRLISDLAVMRGGTVVHLLEPGRREKHVIHPQATLDPSGTIVYPMPRQEGLGF